MTTSFDVTLPTEEERINRWISLDEHHKGRSTAAWWMTGHSSFLSCTASDDEGPICFIRIDKEQNSSFRIHSQFGPREEVSRRRLVDSILDGFPKLIDLVRKQGAENLVFDSVSPSLIRFISKYGFVPMNGTNDYILDFVAVATAEVI